MKTSFSLSFLRICIVDAGPRSERKTTVLVLRSTTRYGDAPMRARPVGGSSQLIGVYMVHAELQVLSLSVEEGKSTFGGVARILAKF